MSFYKADWLNAARRLWEREVVEKLDAFQAVFDDLVSGLPTSYLSKVIDDTAQGIIRFVQNPATDAPLPTAPDQLTRKDYVDGQDTAHASLTAMDDVHGFRTYGDSNYARLQANNTWTADVQNIQSSSPTGRPSWRISESNGSLKFEMYYNEAAGTTNILSYSGADLRLQPGAAGGVSVRDPTYNPGEGELSVENDIRSGGNVYADSSEELLRESDALQVFAFAAYGGLSLVTPNAGADIGLTWEIVQFDTVQPATPRGVTVNLGGNSFSIDNDGVYAFSFSISVEHNEQNQSRQFQLRFWNITDGVQIGAPITVGTGRNVHISSTSLTTLVEITDALKGAQIRLEVGNTTDSYTVVEWNVAEMVVWNVGEWREPLPSDL